MAKKKYLKKRSSSLAIREIKFKQPRFCLILAGKPNKVTDDKCWQGVEEKEASLTVAKTANAQPLWKSIWRMNKQVVINVPFE